MVALAPRVLLVGDTRLEGDFAAVGLPIATVPNAAQAVASLRATTSFSVIVVPSALPDMQPTAFALGLVQHFPDAIVLLCGGTLDDDLARYAKQGRVHHVPAHTNGLTIAAMVGHALTAKRDAKSPAPQLASPFARVTTNPSFKAPPGIGAKGPNAKSRAPAPAPVAIDLPPPPTQDKSTGDRAQLEPFQAASTLVLGPGDILNSSDSLERDRDELREKVAALDVERQLADAKISELERLLKERHAQLDAHAREREGLQLDRDKLRLDVKSLTAQIDKLKKDLDVRENERVTRDAALKAAERGKTQAEAALAKARTEHQSAIAALQAEHQSAIAALHAEHQRAIGALQAEHKSVVEEIDRRRTSAIDDARVSDQDRKKLAQRLAELTAETDEIRRKDEEHRKQLDEARRDRDDAELLLADTEMQVAELRASVVQAKQQISDDAQKHAELEKDVETLRLQLRAAITDLDAERETTGALRDELATAIADAQRKLEEVTAAAAAEIAKVTAATAGELEAVQKQRDEVMRERDDAKTRRDAISRYRDELIQQLDAATKELSAVKKENERLQAQLALATDDLDDLRTTRDAAPVLRRAAAQSTEQSELAALEAELERVRIERDRALQGLTEASRKLMELEDERR